MCENAFYKKDDIRLYCRHTNEFCGHQVYCSKTGKHKLNGYEDKCPLRDKKYIKLNKNEYNVRFEKGGCLYVEVDDQVIKLKNIYGIIPQKVKLTKIKDKYYLKKK